MPERPSSSFDVAVKSYPGDIDLTNQNSSVTKVIERVKPGAKLLEVGCASGYMSHVLVTLKSCSVVGVELNPEAAALAAKHCSRVVVGDLDGDVLDQIDEQFDVITFADVLEHLRTPSTTLTKARRLLRPDGYVIISLPNVAHWDVRIPLLRGRFEYDRTGLLDDSHIRFFTYDTAARLITEAGFDIDSVDVVHKWPRHWRYDRLYRRLERPLHWLTMRYLKGLFGFQFIFVARLPNG
jgi:O-antigen biosynthesis protein